MATKPLTRMQIDATIERLRNMFQGRVLAESKRRAADDTALRKTQLTQMLRRGCTEEQAAAIIVNLSHVKIPGIPNPNSVSYNGALYGEFDDKLKEFRYNLIMADNTSCQDIISGMEAQIAAMLR